jgi:hypothetical protein
LRRLPCLLFRRLPSRRSAAAKRRTRIETNVCGPLAAPQVGNLRHRRLGSLRYVRLGSNLSLAREESFVHPYGCMTGLGTNVIAFDRIGGSSRGGGGRGELLSPLTLPSPR